MKELPDSKSIQPRASFQVIDGPPDDAVEVRGRVLQRQRNTFLVTLAVGITAALFVGYLFAIGYWHIPSHVVADPTPARPGLLMRASIGTILAIVFSAPAFYVQTLMMPGNARARGAVQALSAVVLLYFTFFAL